MHTGDVLARKRSILLALGLLAAGCQSSDSSAPATSSGAAAATPVAAGTGRALAVNVDGEMWRLAEEPITNSGGGVQKCLVLRKPDGTSGGFNCGGGSWSRSTSNVLYKGRFYMAASGSANEQIAWVEIVALTGEILRADVRDGVFFAVTSDPAFVSYSPGCVASGPYPTATCGVRERLAGLKYYSQSGALLCAVKLGELNPVAC